MMILATIIAFWRVPPLSGALLLPYLAWVRFATYLTAGFWRLNGSAEAPSAEPPRSRHEGTPRAWRRCNAILALAASQ